MHPTSGDEPDEVRRRRRRLRWAQDLGLALVALGILVLAYLALSYTRT